MFTTQKLANSDNDLVYANVSGKENKKGKRGEKWDGEERKKGRGRKR